jgi:sorting nexin-4
MIKVQRSILFQLQDAVTTAQETSDAFSDETLREQAVFQFAKEAEMKEMLGNLAKGEIDFYTTVRVLGMYH